MAVATLRPVLERRLKGAVAGEVLTDAFSRGRYATDASHYQVMPLAVVVARSPDDIAATLEVAREEGVAVTARGGGTSQSGQAVNEAVIVDTSRHLDRLLSLDAEARTCWVEPGIVLDDLNRALKPHGLWFPVDISTASRATIGGMVGNNSCGARSLRYGIMRDNVEAIDAILADGTALTFGAVDESALGAGQAGADDGLFRDMLALGRREAEEVAVRFPKVQRRVGGYNLDALTPDAAPWNMAHLLVGSEGTLALSTRIKLKLSPLIGSRATGVCHFGSFSAAMETVRHLVRLKPVAIELIDRTMIALGRKIPMYQQTLDRIVRGDPQALLVVEFAEEPAENDARLAGLADVMAEHGFGFDRNGRHWGGVVPVTDASLQAALTEVRQGGLNIMMSMKEAGKPVSFVEDCAVPLEHLAEYTEGLTGLFARHGTSGTWYAHAAVGCLHVRPILNLKLEKDVRAMRAIAEEAFAMVRTFKGSHSGEHGDGIVRSEFHGPMFGRRIVAAFETVKDRFDPDGLLNPGRVVRAPRMDDRRLLRFHPDYRASGGRAALEWTGFPGADASERFLGAAEMCNNNGACRKSVGGVMCPSFRVTRDETHVTRGRANTLRLALSGQLGRDALASDAMAEAMRLCVSCKACRRECPTGVDMARMKIEVLAARAAANGLSPRERIFAHLPHVAPALAWLRWLTALRDRLPGAGAATERLLGIAAGRSLPTVSRRRFIPPPDDVGPRDGRRVALFADTFTTWFEPEIVHDAIRVLNAVGFRITVPRAADGSRRPLCCGRTFLAAGLVDRARGEAERTVAALAPLAEAGIPILGLEPSCLYTFRDELAALMPGGEAEAIAARAFMFDEFLAREVPAEAGALLFAPMPGRALVHGHCHQKAFGTEGATAEVLGLVPDLAVEAIESSCCGMAGAFGYQAETFAVSMKMAELSLLPAVRAAPDDAFIVAAGTSCRHQIKDGAGRRALHPARLLARALDRTDAGRAGDPPTLSEHRNERR